MLTADLREPKFAAELHFEPNAMYQGRTDQTMKQDSYAAALVIIIRQATIISKHDPDCQWREKHYDVRARVRRDRNNSAEESCQRWLFCGALPRVSARV